MCLINNIIDKATHCYVAFKDCGCWVAVTTDLTPCGEDLAKHTADDVKGFIRSGWRVERMSLEEWRKASFTGISKCPHKDMPHVASD